MQGDKDGSGAKIPGAESLLSEFIEAVLVRGELGRCASLFSHRAQLYLPRARCIYSQPLIEDALGELLWALSGVHLGIEEIWSGEEKYSYPLDRRSDSAAALLRLGEEDSSTPAALLMLRSSGGRIQSLRVELSPELLQGFVPEERLPVAQIEVSPLSQQGGEQARRVLEAARGDFPAQELSACLADLAGLPTRAVLSRSDDALFTEKGGLFVDELTARRDAGGVHRIVFAWYKGLLVPRGAGVVPDYAPLAGATISGMSLLELRGEELLRDVRLYDESRYDELVLRSAEPSAEEESDVGDLR